MLYTFGGVLKPTQLLYTFGRFRRSDVSCPHQGSSSLLYKSPTHMQKQLNKEIIFLHEMTADKGNDIHLISAFNHQRIWKH